MLKIQPIKHLSTIQRNITTSSLIIPIIRSGVIDFVVKIFVPIKCLLKLQTF